MSDKYNERVRAIATEMAKEMHPTAFADRSKSVQDNNLWYIKIDNYMPAARIAVAQMAEAVGTSLSSGIVDYLARLPVSRRLEIITEFVIQQGLIPDSAQEGGKNE